MGREGLGRGRPVDDGPVDDQQGRPVVRVIDIGDGDLLAVSALDRLDDRRVADSRGDAFPLQAGLHHIDAAGHIGRKHQFKIDGFGAKG